MQGDRNKRTRPPTEVASKRKPRRSLMPGSSLNDPGIRWDRISKAIARPLWNWLRKSAQFPASGQRSTMDATTVARPDRYRSVRHGGRPENGGRDECQYEFTNHGEVSSLSRKSGDRPSMVRSIGSAGHDRCAGEHKIAHFRRTSGTRSIAALFSGRNNRQAGSPRRCGCARPRVSAVARRLEDLMRPACYRR